MVSGAYSGKSTIITRYRKEHGSKFTAKLLYLRVRKLKAGDTKHDFSRGDDEELGQEPEHVDGVWLRQVESVEVLLVSSRRVSGDVKSNNGSLEQFDRADERIFGMDPV